MLDFDEMRRFAKPNIESGLNHLYAYRPQKIELTLPRGEWLGINASDKDSNDFLAAVRRPNEKTKNDHPYLVDGDLEKILCHAAEEVFTQATQGRDARMLNYRQSRIGRGGDDATAILKL